MSGRHPPRVAELMRLMRMLKADEDKPVAELKRRDRAIGRQLQHLQHDPVTQTQAWMKAVHAPAERDDGAGHAVFLALALAGLGTGWAAALGAFFYEGAGRVNVVALLGLFVGLQLVLLFLFCLAAMPPRALAWLPGGRALNDAVQAISPGRLGGLVARWLPRRRREALESLAARGMRHDHVFGQVQKWQILSWSQIMAVAFNAGAIVTALCLVVFTDLAFGWSTTLRLNPATLHCITGVIAWPWSDVLPGAVPTLDLVEESRYFRLGGASGEIPDPERAAMLGGWWPFVLASMIVYGLGLRVLAYCFAAWRLRRATRHAFVHAPGVQALRDRLNTTLVETRSDEDGEGGTYSAGKGTAPRAASINLAGRRRIVNWADVPLADNELAQALNASAGLAPVAVHRAGGGQGIDTDLQVVETVAADASCEGVVIVTKAWEPPLMELVDFVAQLRDGAREGLPIAVMPVRVVNGTIQRPTEREARPWRRRIETIGDPWTEFAEFDPDKDNDGT